jgi:Spy/CpxP family protein refolding chaperone
MKRVVSLLIAVAVTAGGSVWAAEFRMPQGRWWQNPRLVERLHITPEQQKQMHDLVFAHAQRMIDLNAAVKKAELQLGDLAERDNFDVKAVRAAFARLQEARQRLESERFELLVGFRQLMTAQQWRQLNALRSEVRRRIGDRWQQRRKRRQLPPPEGDQPRPPDDR